MLGISITLAALFLLNGGVRMLSEILVALDLDLTGEIDEHLNLIVSTIQSGKLVVVLELFLFLGIVVWVYFSGYILCSQLIFTGIAATFWPQRYFN
jgi:hypothetical protein